ncbi:hypothetical protein ACFQ9Z_27550 [Streptomyces sp. NPDC056580]|uniref:hypothetical protein n=1 Tax=Streptomyces sp. NPDC056580 TaxID=3345872 RepID=UPI00368C1606
MSRALPKYDKRRVAVIGGAAAVVLSGAVIAGSALAGTPDGSGGAANARTLAAPGTVSCPDVASRLPSAPASAKAEVDRSLALLQTQIKEANTRLAGTVGQGGPNFVDNAVLGPPQGQTRLHHRPHRHRRRPHHHRTHRPRHPRRLHTHQVR